MIKEVNCKDNGWFIESYEHSFAFTRNSGCGFLVTLSWSMARESKGSHVIPYPPVFTALIAVTNNCKAAWYQNNLFYHAAHIWQLLHYEGGVEMHCWGWCCSFGSRPEFQQLQPRGKQQEQGRMVSTGVDKILFHLPTLQRVFSKMLPLTPM